MKSKADIRKQLEAGMLQFKAAGKQVTQLPAQKSRSKRAEPKEEVVEIEVQHLPPSLQAKYFAE